MSGLRVLIAGCGDVGGLLGARLAATGHTPFGLRREVAGVPAGVMPIAADLGEPASLARLPTPFDAVVYCATPGGSSDAAYHATYVAGQANLAAALDACDALPSRWVFTSSTSVYGDAHGGRVDEESPTEPAGHGGRRLLEAEALVAGLAGRGVQHPSSVRFGGIYGPGRTWLIERVRAGATCSDTPPLYTNRIHREDCAGVLAHVLELPDPAPCYVAVDSDPAAQCEVMDWIAARLGVERPRRVPARRASKRCGNARLLASGFVLRYPGYRDGYAPMLTAVDEPRAGR